MAQGGAVAPPEPKIKVPKEVSGESVPAPSSPANTENLDGEVFGDSWDSYTEKPEELAADDVTKRIRVEDIVEPPSEYHFAAFGKDDPFVPPLIAQEVNSIEVPIISPLQRHPLSAMGLTGVWGGAAGERKALVTVSDFSRGILGVVVKVGDPIGSSGGKVVAINKDGMSVREFHLSPDGSRIYEDRFLMLGDKPPIPMVSGNVVFRPGDSTGVVVDPVDRAGSQGVVVDPDGPMVYDRLWQTDQIRSLKVEPAVTSKGAPVAVPQGPLPSPAQQGQGNQAALSGEGAQAAQTLPASQPNNNQQPATQAPSNGGLIPPSAAASQVAPSQPAAGAGSAVQNSMGQQGTNPPFISNPVSPQQQTTTPAPATLAPSSNPVAY